MAPASPAVAANPDENDTASSSERNQLAAAEEAARRRQRRTAAANGAAGGREGKVGVGPPQDPQRDPPALSSSGGGGDGGILGELSSSTIATAQSSGGVGHGHGSGSGSGSGPLEFSLSRLFSKRGSGGSSSAAAAVPGSGSLAAGSAAGEEEGGGSGSTGPASSENGADRPVNTGSGGGGGGGDNVGNRSASDIAAEAAAATAAVKTSATASASTSAGAAGTRLNSLSKAAENAHHNQSVTSMMSGNSAATDDGTLSATGHFSIASLPAIKTNILHSGLFTSPHRRRNGSSESSTSPGGGGGNRRRSEEAEASRGQQQQQGSGKRTPPTRPGAVPSSSSVSGGSSGSNASLTGSGRAPRRATLDLISPRAVISRRFTSGGDSGSGSPMSPSGLSRRVGFGARSSSIRKIHKQGNFRGLTSDLTMGGGPGSSDGGSVGSGGGGRGKGRSRSHHIVDLDDFDYVHPREANEPALGENCGVVPTSRPGDTIRVYVAEKIFYSQVRGKTFRIHSNTNSDRERWERRKRNAEPPELEEQQKGQGDGDSGRTSDSNEGTEAVQESMPPAPPMPFDLAGKTTHSRDMIVLGDREGRTIGVIARRYVHYDKRFDILGVQPVSPQQRPSENYTTRGGDPLYLRARVIGNLKGRLSIDMFTVNNTFQTDVYRIHKLKTRFMEGKTLYITKSDKMAALVKHGAFPRGVKGPAWDGTVAPGIDPCLLVCLIAILDETNRI